jgi:hypothetical protein
MKLEAVQQSLRQSSYIQSVLGSPSEERLLTCRHDKQENQLGTLSTQGNKTIS